MKILANGRIRLSEFSRSIRLSGGERGTEALKRLSVTGGQRGRVFPENRVKKAPAAALPGLPYSGNYCRMRAADSSANCLL